MFKYLAKKEKGFTLMELLIAVGIMAVLAGVGVPLYLQLQTGAKATEANVHLDSIRTCEESYKLVNNAYIDCAASPRGSVADPTGVAGINQDPAAWVASTGFTAIGFAPNASVRFAYAVGGATPTAYSVGGVGDTNGDATRILYIATESAGPHIVTATDATPVADISGATAFNDNTLAVTLTAD